MKCFVMSSLYIQGNILHRCAASAQCMDRNSRVSEGLRLYFQYAFKCPGFQTQNSLDTARMSMFRYDGKKYQMSDSNKTVLPTEKHSSKRNSDQEQKWSLISKQLTDKFFYKLEFMLQYFSSIAADSVDTHSSLSSCFLFCLVVFHCCHAATILGNPLLVDELKWMVRKWTPTAQITDWFELQESP